MLISVIVDDKMTIDQIPEEMRQRAVAGSPEAIAEQIKSKVFDAGIDGIIFNMPVYTSGAVAAVGEALEPYLAG
jgi:alkanesulfonate monooxygenase SsuD/methylene tetrahydromethanopterin reductase-like flavin-dependent oxidoreductase (luciferase family)